MGAINGPVGRNGLTEAEAVDGFFSMLKIVLKPQVPSSELFPQSHLHAIRNFTPAILHVYSEQAKPFKFLFWKCAALFTAGVHLVLIWLCSGDLQ